METHHKPKWGRKYIYLHEQEVPLFLKKIYHEHSKPDVCAFCKRKSEFLGIEIFRKVNVRTFKVCRDCLRRFAKS